MICPEIQGRVRNPAPVVRQRYSELHPEGKRLIAGWFNRANAPRAGDGDLFEAFIYAWIAMNAWGACVTGEDKDRRYVVALAGDRGLGREFSELRANDPEFEQAVLLFAGFWPIFRVTDLRKHHLLHRWPGGDRDRQVDYYLSGGATEVAPECSLRHRRAGERPDDWAHTLSAIYRVRCNLFHGEKSAHSEMDRGIVAAAFDVLTRFIRGAGLFASAA
jgi:hypothetical protein